MKCPHCERPIDRPYGNEVLSGGSPVLILSCPACDKIVGTVPGKPAPDKAKRRFGILGRRRTL